MAIDERQIRSVLEQDRQEGFRLLMKAFEKPLYWHVRRLVVSHDDAKDVMQETFVRIWKGLDGFRWNSKLSVWAYRIATNEAMRLLGERKTENCELDDADGMSADNYIDYDNGYGVTFQKALQTLPAKQRAIFELRWWDEMDYEEIGKIVGTSATSAKASYHYAKEKVMNYIKDRMR